MNAAGEAAALLEVAAGQMAAEPQEQQVAAEPQLEQPEVLPVSPGREEGGKEAAGSREPGERPRVLAPSQGCMFCSQRLP